MGPTPLSDLFMSESFSCILPTAHSGHADLGRIDSCLRLKRNLYSWTCTFKILLINLIISWEATCVL